ncbi:MAG: hypothetical protein PHH00_03835, partial [Candidatus Nanoarchaeia archaeon]|nr:hypothetical protein [Candidatus Nanoarchaeia archaeon]
ETKVKLRNIIKGNVILKSKEREWSKVINFLKKRSNKINLDVLIKEANFQRESIRKQNRELFEQFNKENRLK